MKRFGHDQRAPLDGTDVPVLVGGKPSGETIGIKRLDGHCPFTVAKLNGQPYALRG